MSLLDVNDYFIAKGATHYFDSNYPTKTLYSLEKGFFQEAVALFSRHYFRPDGLEIGYCIPDLRQGPHDLEIPRKWDNNPQLKELK